MWEVLKIKFKVFLKQIKMETIVNQDMQER